MKTLKLIVAAFVVFISIQTMAQENEKRFGFEFSGGASMAVNKLADAKLKLGYGYEGIFHYRFMPHTGIYAGWGLNRLPAENSFAGNNTHFEETGYVFGLQFKRPLNSSLSYFLRAGGLYSHIEIDNEEGETIHDTGHGFGFQLAGGLDISLDSKWSLTPGIKFNSLCRDLEIEGTRNNLELNYLSVRVGILRRF